FAGRTQRAHVGEVSLGTGELDAERQQPLEQFAVEELDDRSLWADAAVPEQAVDGGPAQQPEGRRLGEERGECFAYRWIIDRSLPGRQVPPRSQFDQQLEAVC